jgi:hypothetical protein
MENFILISSFIVFGLAPLTGLIINFILRNREFRIHKFDKVSFIVMIILILCWFLGISFKIALFDFIVFYFICAIIWYYLWKISIRLKTWYIRIPTLIITITLVLINYFSISLGILAFGHVVITQLPRYEKQISKNLDVKYYIYGHATSDNSNNEIRLYKSHALSPIEFCVSKKKYFNKMLTDSLNIDYDDKNKVLYIADDDFSTRDTLYLK